MRIISGTHKGKRLVAPKKLTVRPTKDMAKESLFNILEHRYHLENMKVMDLFAGTGNISFEFASRGVTQIVAVDSFQGCIQFISKTSDELKFPITPIKSDVYRFLERFSGKIDLIFADPPYDFEPSRFNRIIELVLEREILSEEGVLIVEHSSGTDLGKHTNLLETRRYGGSIFSFFVLKK